MISLVIAVMFSSPSTAFFSFSGFLPVMIILLPFKASSFAVSSPISDPAPMINFPPLQNANALDTNARLLYRLDKKQQAIEMESKAVETYRLSGTTMKSFEKILTQMINGTL